MTATQLSEAGPELLRQHHSAMAAKARLYGHAGARPGANLPRTVTAPYRQTERQAVDFGFAMGLVSEDQQVSPDQILHGTYCAAIAARHMLWTVLFDGGHPPNNIARIFKVDDSTVRLGIKAFRDFQKASFPSFGDGR